MSINVIQAILIGLLYYLAISGTPWLTAFIANYVRQPLVNGFLVGCILGDPVKGLIIGSAINLPFIGIFLVGGTMPSDSALAGIVGTTFAMLSNVSPEVAVAMAVPIGLLGNIVQTVHMTKNIGFVHMMDVAAKEGDIKKIKFLHVVPPQFTTMLISAIPVSLIVYFGADSAKNVLDSLSGAPLDIMTVLGGVLPALGISLTLRQLLKEKSMILFFLVGFLMVTYQNLSMIVVAIFATAIAYFYTELKPVKARG